MYKIANVAFSETIYRMVSSNIIDATAAARAIRKESFIDDCELGAICTMKLGASTDYMLGFVARPHETEIEGRVNVYWFTVIHGRDEAKTMANAIMRKLSSVYDAVKSAIGEVRVYSYLTVAGPDSVNMMIQLDGTYGVVGESGKTEAFVIALGSKSIMVMNDQNEVMGVVAYDQKINMASFTNGAMMILGVFGKGLGEPSETDGWMIAKIAGQEKWGAKDGEYFRIMNVNDLGMSFDFVKPPTDVLMRVKRFGTTSSYAVEIRMRGRVPSAFMMDAGPQTLQGVLDLIVWSCMTNDAGVAKFFIVGTADGHTFRILERAWWLEQAIIKMQKLAKSSSGVMLHIMSVGDNTRSSAVSSWSSIGVTDPWKFIFYPKNWWRPDVNRGKDQGWAFDHASGLWKFIGVPTTKTIDYNAEWHRACDAYHVAMMAQWEAVIDGKVIRSDSEVARAVAKAEREMVDLGVPVESTAAEILQIDAKVGKLIMNRVMEEASGAFDLNRAEPLEYLTKDHGLRWLTIHVPKNGDAQAVEVQYPNVLTRKMMQAYIPHEETIWIPIALNGKLPFWIVDAIYDRIGAIMKKSGQKMGPLYRILGPYQGEIIQLMFKAAGWNSDSFVMYDEMMRSLKKRPYFFTIINPDPEGLDNISFQVVPDTKSDIMSVRVETLTDSRGHTLIYSLLTGELERAPDMNQVVYEALEREMAIMFPKPWMARIVVNGESFIMRMTLRSIRGFDREVDFMLYGVTRKLPINLTVDWKASKIDGLPDDLTSFAAAFVDAAGKIEEAVRKWDGIEAAIRHYKDNR